MSSSPDHKASDRAIRHLTQLELARRWNISARTLERWRWLGQGPIYLKLGGRVAYPLADVEFFEAGQRNLETTVDRSSTPASSRLS